MKKLSYFTKQEIQILYYRLLKKGYNPKEAKEEMKTFLTYQRKMEKEKQEQEKSKDLNKNFKEEFNKIKNG